MSESEITEILNKYKVIAVVGLSDQLGKPSHRVAAYLKNHGYKIVPVNPTINSALGEKSYSSLLTIPPIIQQKIDIVSIFRKSEDIPQVVEQAIKMKRAVGRPFVVWMQLDIVNEKAAEVARQAGIAVVMDKCLMKEHLHRRQPKQPQE